MHNLNADYEKFKALNAVIFPILADTEKGAKKLESECDECKIPIFFDKDKDVVTALNQEVILSKLGRMPAVIIIDRDGIVRYAYFGESMSDIPPNDELFKALQSIQNK